MTSSQVLEPLYLPRLPVPKLILQFGDRLEFRVPLHGFVVFELSLFDGPVQAVLLEVQAGSLGNQLAVVEEGFRDISRRAPIVFGARFGRG